MKENWNKIPDNRVRHIWFCVYEPNSIAVDPDWYEENGTPICGCGEDMVYSHTEILNLVNEKENQ